MVTKGNEVLRKARGAVASYRKLAKAKPEFYRPVLASGLSYLGYILGNSGRFKEALKAAREAEAIIRQLATEEPDYLPVLAASLNNLGLALDDFGLHDEAAKATREAEKIRKKLLNQS